MRHRYLLWVTYGDDRAYSGHMLASQMIYAAYSLWTSENHPSTL
jgi:hypothetical protein